MRLGQGGRVVLAEAHPGDPPLPPDLALALREWAAVAAAVMSAGGDAQECEQVRRRGQRLAQRIADALGRPVEYVDPVTGSVEVVPTMSREPVPLLRPEPAGPVPWATGLPVAAFFAVFTALADVLLSSAFAEAFGLLWVPANLLVGVGLAPSLWLLRHTPLWRWPALGVAAGLVAAWLVLVLGMLG
ncbi:MAG TPA: DUF2537 domain-containing protein [Pseudonocardia sp.]|nr:DUF2537 domain-containing protein [Pseudonocardia sp.]